MKPVFQQNGFGIDFPGNPKFNINMANCSRKEITTEFYLVNTNTKWLKDNFKFIQAFYAGSEWLHLPFCQIRPPNVYHVLCPGRFQIYWAALDIKITFQGKLRENEEASNYFIDQGIKSITKNMLWPEAWKVEINIKDLTPNNFNLYAEYYEHGFKAEEIARLEKEIGLIEGIKDAITYMKSLFDETKNYGKELINEAKEQGQKIIDSVKGLASEMDAKPKENK